LSVGGNDATYAARRTLWTSGAMGLTSADSNHTVRASHSTGPADSH
jgi:hypothetical protein